MKKSTALVLIIMLLLCMGGCGSEYTPIIYELNEDANKLVTNPSVEYVITALSQVDSVIGIEIDDTPQGDATIFFSSNLVDQTQVSGSGVARNGTDGGGSIDIYTTSEAAQKRDEYLSGFDGLKALNSGGHAVAGTMVIRTSSKLGKEKQTELTQAIVDALTLGDITDDMIAKAMAAYDTALEENDTTTTAESTNQTPVPLDFLDSFDEYGYTVEQIEEMRTLLVNVGITQIDDLEIQPVVYGMQVIKGILYKDTSLGGGGKEVQVQFNIENGVIYLVAIYCPSYQTANQPTYLSGLTDRRADLYYDVEGGYLKKIDWENRAVIDY